MGYSTMLFAVDIGQLQAACGSKDSALLERLRSQSGSDRKQVDPTSGPRVRVTWNSEIYLNGKLVPPEELKVALLNPDWAGTNLYMYNEIKPPPGQKREGPFKEIGSFGRFFMTFFQFFQERGLVFKDHYISIENCSTEEQFNNAGGPDDEISVDQALEELIGGSVSRPEEAHVYGYALEELCRAIGTILDSVGTDRLRSLKLKTPLSKVRVPVKLPKNDDFPYISYLDADELRAEVSRLRTLDLAYPDDPEVEQERRYFLQLLEKAVAHNVGVVGFYH